MIHFACYAKSGFTHAFQKRISHTHKCGIKRNDSECKKSGSPAKSAELRKLAVYLLWTIFSKKTGFVLLPSRCSSRPSEATWMWLRDRGGAAACPVKEQWIYHKATGSPNRLVLINTTQDINSRVPLIGLGLLITLHLTFIYNFPCKLTTVISENIFIKTRKGKKTCRSSCYNTLRKSEDILLISWKIQIKSTARYHLTPVRMTTINKSTSNKC